MSFEPPPSISIVAALPTSENAVLSVISIMRRCSGARPALLTCTACCGGVVGYKNVGANVTALLAITMWRLMPWPVTAIICVVLVAPKMPVSGTTIVPASVSSSCGVYVTMTVALALGASVVGFAGNA